VTRIYKNSPARVEFATAQQATASSGKKFDRVDRDTTESRLCFKARKRFLKVKRLRIEPWSGVPALNRVIKVLDFRNGGLAIARERDSNARNCFSEQKRIIE